MPFSTAGQADLSRAVGPTAAHAPLLIPPAPCVENVQTSDQTAANLSTCSSVVMYAIAWARLSRVSQAGNAASATTDPPAHPSFARISAAVRCGDDGQWERTERGAPCPPAGFGRAEFHGARPAGRGVRPQSPKTEMRRGEPGSEHPRRSIAALRFWPPASDIRFPRTTNQEPRTKDQDSRARRSLAPPAWSLEVWFPAFRLSQFQLSEFRLSARPQAAVQRRLGRGGGYGSVSGSTRTAVVSLSGAGPPRS